MNQNDMEIAVSPATYVAIEKVLGPRVEYTTFEAPGQRVRHGIRLRPTFGPSTYVFPDGPGISATDAIAAVLLGEFK